MSITEQDYLAHDAIGLAMIVANGQASAAEVLEAAWRARPRSIRRSTRSRWTSRIGPGENWRRGRRAAHSPVCRFC